MIRCDGNGVPCLIQELEFQYGSLVFKATFFNGEKRYFCGGYVCPSLGLLEREPSNLQFLEAEQKISHLSARHWDKWYNLKPTNVYNLFQPKGD